MGIGVLGPLLVDGSTSGVGRRDRVVLSALCTRPGGSVSTESLVDALWAADPPASALKVLHGCISRLRRLLGAHAIETTPYGYRLTLDPDQVDAHVFAGSVERARELLAVGEADPACYVAEQGLRLWRGRPLADLQSWEQGAVEASRLEELRLEAEELRVDALLRSGRHGAAQADAAGLVRAAPLRERRWALLALAQARVGRQADALQTLREARSLLARELGIDPGPELRALQSAILRQDASLGRPEPPAVPAGGCPYRGLEAFDPEDADSFFGREADLATCLDLLHRDGVLTLVGPSGLGKSSLARAGVAASLERAGVGVEIVTPGRRPLEALEALSAAARSRAWIVDQAEEAFTLCQDEATRTAFLDALLSHAREGSPLVLVLRSDRLADVASHQALARRVERSLYLLGPMEEASLRAAIEEPARRNGLLLEPGLVELLLREVDLAPGALPLLSHALRETWRRREGRTLTVAAYRATGGIRGAVSQTAEALYTSVPAQDRAQLRGVVLRLVSPGAHGEPVCARVHRRLVVTHPSQEGLVDALVEARLVTSDDDELQLAHESLGRSWPRLAEWLADDVEGRRILHHLTVTADAWQSAGRPEGDLYRGARLHRAVQWLDAQVAGRGHDQEPLSPVERTFLASSSAAEDEEESRVLAARSRSIDDPELALLVAVEGVRTDDNPQARSALRDALARRPELIATSAPTDSSLVHLLLSPDGRTLVGVTAEQGIRTFDAESGAVLATRSVAGRRSRTVHETCAWQFTPDGGALLAGGQLYRHPALTFLDATTLEPQPRTLAGLPERAAKVVEVDHSADGRFLAISFVYADLADPRPGPETIDAADVRIWDLERAGEDPVVIPGPTPAPFWDWLKLSPDGRSVYLSNTMRRVDVPTGRVLWQRPDITTGHSFALSTDGRRLAVSFPDRLLVLDASTGETLAGFAEDAHAVVFSPDDRWLVSATPLGTRVRAVESGEVRLVLPSPVGKPVFSHDSSLLYVAPAGAASFQTWDLVGGRRFLERQDLGLSVFHYEIWPTFSPSGRHLATVSEGEERPHDTATLFDVGTPTAERLAAVDVGEVGVDTPVGWRRDGRQLAVGNIDGEVTLIELDGTSRRVPWSGAPIVHLDYVPDGHALVVVDRARRLHVVDASDGRPLSAPTALSGAAPRWVAVSPSGRDTLVLSASGGGEVGTHPEAFTLERRHLRDGTVATSRTFLVEQVGELRSVAYAPDGTRVLLIGDAGPVLLDPESLESLDRPIDSPAERAAGRPPRGIEGGGFSPDGRTIVTGSQGGSVALWDGHHARFLESFPVSRASNVVPHLGPDPSVIRVVTGDGELVAVPRDPEAALRAALRIAGRSLTSEEWATLVGFRDDPHE